MRKTGRNYRRRGSEKGAQRLRRWDKRNDEGAYRSDSGMPLFVRQPDGQTIRLVPIVIRLVRPIHRHADVRGLIRGELGQLHAELLEVQACDLLVEMLGKG